MSLELGGKDPMIVLADADLERAANAAVYYSMQNGGQTCISIERVYVEAPVYDEFVAKVTEKVRGAAPGRAGRAGDASTSARSRSRRSSTSCERHVEQARDAGARVHDRRPRARGHGRFFEPTVLADVDHSMTAMTEETFGPTLPIMKVADAEEAIRLANDSPYGLGAVGVDQGRRARRGDRPPASRPARCASTTRSSTTSRSSCRWAAGRTPASACATAPAGIRKYTRQQALLVTRFALKQRPAHVPVPGAGHADAGPA